MSTSFLQVLQCLALFPSFGHICNFGSKISTTLEVTSHSFIQQVLSQYMFCFLYAIKGLKIFG